MSQFMLFCFDLKREAPFFFCWSLSVEMFHTAYDEVTFLKWEGINSVLLAVRDCSGSIFESSLGKCKQAATAVLAAMYLEVCLKATTDGHNYTLEKKLHKYASLPFSL